MSEHLPQRVPLAANRGQVSMQVDAETQLPGLNGRAHLRKELVYHGDQVHWAGAGGRFLLQAAQLDQVIEGNVHALAGGADALQEALLQRAERADRLLEQHVRVADHGREGLAQVMQDAVEGVEQGRVGENGLPAGLLFQPALQIGDGLSSLAQTGAKAGGFHLGGVQFCRQGLHVLRRLRGFRAGALDHLQQLAVFLLQLLHGRLGFLLPGQNGFQLGDQLGAGGGLLFQAVVLRLQLLQSGAGGLQLLLQLARRRSGLTGEIGTDRLAEGFEVFKFLFVPCGKGVEGKQHQARQGAFGQIERYSHELFDRLRAQQGGPGLQIRGWSAVFRQPQRVSLLQRVRQGGHLAVLQIQLAQADTALEVQTVHQAHPGPGGVHQTGGVRPVGLGQFAQQDRQRCARAGGQLEPAFELVRR